MPVNYLQLKSQFYELIGQLSIEEIISNRSITPVIEQISRMLVSMTDRGTT